LTVIRIYEIAYLIEIIVESNFFFYGIINQILSGIMVILNLVTYTIFYISWLFWINFHGANSKSLIRIFMPQNSVNCSKHVNKRKTGYLQPVFVLLNFIYFCLCQILLLLLFWFFGHKFWNYFDNYKYFYIIIWG
jgi:hypothetical protein